MSFNLTSSAAIIAKAGAGMNSIFLVASGAVIMAKWCDQAEGTLSTLTRRNWIASSLAINFNAIIDDTVSDLVAMKVINYDMSGYTSRAEAQTMLSLIDDNFNRNLVILKDQDLLRTAN